jgi:hypothetical protein
VDLAHGFQIEEPAVFVPWGVSEPELLALLPSKPRHVTDGYYVIECTSLAGLRHMLGFHFQPRTNGKLVELEFFRRAYPDLRASFDDFESHLEATFGPPDTSVPGDQGLPNYTWRRGAASVRHLVFDRFGPEEHVRIARY